MVNNYKKSTAFFTIALSFASSFGCGSPTIPPQTLTTLQIDALKARAAKDFPGCTVPNLNHMPCQDLVSSVWCANSPAMKKYYISDTPSSTTWYSVSDIQSHLDHAESLRKEAAERMAKLNVGDKMMMCVSP